MSIQSFHDSRPRLTSALLLAAVFVLQPTAHGANNPGQSDGIAISKPSIFRQLVPASGLERQASTEYEALKRQAAEQRALATENHPQLRRLRAIADRMIPLASRYNSRAAQWQWEINLIGSKQVNAFCMPGGKIAFFTGLLEGLKLTDDEAAIVMGHEIAHALREHARERMAKGELTNLELTCWDNSLPTENMPEFFALVVACSPCAFLAMMKAMPISLDSTLQLVPASTHAQASPSGKK